MWKRSAVRTFLSYFYSELVNRQQQQSKKTNKQIRQMNKTNRWTRSATVRCILSIHLRFYYYYHYYYTCYKLHINLNKLRIRLLQNNRTNSDAFSTKSIVLKEVIALFARKRTENKNQIQSNFDGATKSAMNERINKV